MSYLSSFFSHAQQVQAAAGSFGVAATVDLADFSLRLQGNVNHAVWKPRFLARREGRLHYAEQMQTGTAGFAGWLPYAIRRWPAGTSKSAFKRMAASLGLSLPESSTQAPPRGAGMFLVKQERGSFGVGMRGPFAAGDPSLAEQQLGAGEYWERFAAGDVLKAWCWGGECVAIQNEPMTRVTGDGRSTLEQLVLALPNQQAGHDWPTVAALAVGAGVHSLQAVIPRGRQVLVEYRYGSRYTPLEYRNTNALARMREAGTARAMEAAAAALWDQVASETQLPRTLYTLDAVLTPEDEVLFLEMNCSPMVHPDAYAAMLRDTWDIQTENKSRNITA